MEIIIPWKEFVDAALPKVGSGFGLKDGCEYSVSITAVRRGRFGSVADFNFHIKEKHGN